MSDVILLAMAFAKSKILDCLDEGWMRRFGIDMCKEIRKQLIKDKMLFSFRITQIKEKYGTLRFYVASASREIYSIINKDRCQ